MAGHDVHRDGMKDDPTIAAFARDLQDAAAATPAPAVGASLAAVLDGSVPTDVYPEVVLPGQLRRGRRSLRLRWAAASAAFGIGAGSLGVAGALPGPVQRQVSRMAEVVGVDLPDGRPTTTTITPPAPPVSVPASTSVPQRPPATPAEDRPAPTTVPEDDPSNRGNHEGRGRGDELGSDPTPSPAPDADVDDPRGDLEDELDEDRSGPSDAEDELGEDSGEDEDDEKSDDRSGHGGDEDDEDEGREP